MHFDFSTPPALFVLMTLQPMIMGRWLASRR